MDNDTKVVLGIVAAVLIGAAGFVCSATYVIYRVLNALDAIGAG